MMMEAISRFDFITKFSRQGLVMLNIQPESYRFLFPAGKDAETIRHLVAEGFFPTIPNLAPAITYGIILSVFRFAIQLFLLKLLLIHNMSMMILHPILQPMAIAAMKIKFVPQIVDREIEAHFPAKSKKTIEDVDVEKFCVALSASSSAPSKSGRTVEGVHKYLWDRKRNALKLRKVVKFVEAAWRFLMYGFFVLVGYYTLFVPTTAPWILDTNQHWDKWPDHRITSKVELYYQIQLGSYLHQLVWTEVSRSDALEMLIHHFVTSTLLVFSFITNHTRVGSSILLLHDMSDVLLESAKCLNYTSKAPGHGWVKIICDTCFACFAITFFVTRLVLYPRHIIYSVFFEAPNHFGVDWAGFWVFSALLVVLQFLHIFWFYLIARMIYRLLTTGVDKDERSDDEEEVDYTEGEDDEDGAGENNGSVISGGKKPKTK